MAGGGALSAETWRHTGCTPGQQRHSRVVLITELPHLFHIGLGEEAGLPGGPGTWRKTGFLQQLGAGAWGRAWA